MPESIIHMCIINVRRKVRIITVSLKMRQNMLIYPRNVHTSSAVEVQFLRFYYMAGGPWICEILMDLGSINEELRSHRHDQKTALPPLDVRIDLRSRSESFTLPHLS